MTVRAKTPVQTEAVLVTTPAANSPNTTLFERFLELPVLLILLSMWLAGAVLMGLCILTLYELLRLLLGLAGL